MIIFTVTNFTDITFIVFLLMIILMKGLYNIACCTKMFFEIVFFRIDK